MAPVQPSTPSQPPAPKPEAIPTPAPETKPEALAAAPAPSGKVACPEGMRAIQGGSFKAGSAASDPMRNHDEQMLTPMTLKPFCVDRYEYPNSAGSTPTTGVSLNKAKELCAKQKKRLCNEFEWEMACKGPAQYRFPYGDQFNADACNTEDAGENDRAIVPSGTFQQCRSGYGVMDMSGNVAEWTSTGKDGVVRGGSSDQPNWRSRCANRRPMPANSAQPSVGFRCCADPL
ncbi:MAG: Hercynine oxygenase [Myxococcota bacterium]|nr:Hercynine oxygenase [Myxococcota bacterium]